MAIKWNITAFLSFSLSGVGPRLHVDGNIMIIKTQTYTQRLVSAGFDMDGNRGHRSFSDHQDHILIFWACSMSRCAFTLVHTRLSDSPAPSGSELAATVLRASSKSLQKANNYCQRRDIQAVLDLVPNFKTISLSQLQSIGMNDVASLSSQTDTPNRMTLCVSCSLRDPLGTRRQ
jgi:hypothetical protein